VGAARARNVKAVSTFHRVTWRHGQIWVRKNGRRVIMASLLYLAAARRISPGIRQGMGTEHMATTNPLQFIQQVRAEVAKIVWPTRREVLLTTIMVFIMATLTAIFFALVDLGIRSGLQGLLSAIGSG